MEGKKTHMWLQSLTLQTLTLYHGITKQVIHILNKKNSCVKRFCFFPSYSFACIVENKTAINFLF